MNNINTKKRRGSLTDEAYRRLKKEILENRLPPGAHSLEQDLAKQLGMSRTPVRSAMIKLQEEGLVEVIPRKGMRVLPLSPEDMREIYGVLTCVESEAAALIARQQPGKDKLEVMRKATLDMEAAIKTDDLSAWAEADNRYHRELLGLCPNKRLANIAFTYMDQAHRVRVFTLRLRKKPVQSTRDHKEQLTAIMSGDAEKVRKMYRRHRERAGDELMKILEAYRLYYL